MFELVLNYLPQGCADHAAVAVARCDDLGLIRTVAAHVLKDAEREAAMWQRVDPTLAAMRRADIGRLTAILGQCK